MSGIVRRALSGPRGPARRASNGCSPPPLLPPSPEPPSAALLGGCGIRRLLMRPSGAARKAAARLLCLTCSSIELLLPSAAQLTLRRRATCGPPDPSIDQPQNRRSAARRGEPLPYRCRPGALWPAGPLQPEAAGGVLQRHGESGWDWAGGGRPCQDATPGAPRICTFLRAGTAVRRRGSVPALPRGPPQLHLHPRSAAGRVPALFGGRVKGKLCADGAREGPNWWLT
jgi:hypothetical protein